ncbi:MAG: PQQ-dependent sugar dehydrogenase [Planctomycetota bacterium]
MRTPLPLGLPALAAAVWMVAAAAQAVFPTSNPINATIPQSSFTVEIEDVLTIPNSDGQAPRMEDLVFGGEPGAAYVVDQRGPVYKFDPSDANPAPELFFDLYDVVGNANINFQTGVRGMAFHPDFNTPNTPGYRKFYTSHSRNPFSSIAGANTKFFFSPNPPGITHDSVVGEFTVDANGEVVSSSYRELFRVGQPETDHNIGQIGFDPTAQPGDADYGNLYIALGDGGGAGNPYGLAQNRTTITSANSGGLGFPHGSILRVNPIATTGAAFQVPADNPFVGEANAIEEVWAYGLRNPHKFAWDPVTGKMLISDIGQSNVEEVNLGAAGANYGWSEREGTFDLVSTDVVTDLPANHPSDGFTYPVAQYDHDPDNDNQDGGLDAIVGGPVYRGNDLPGLTGRYVLGDFSANDALYSVGVGDLVQRDDFSDLANLNGGLLAPLEEIRLTRNGSPTSLLTLIRAESGNQGLNRTDIRIEAGPDGEVYVLNKHDGTVRRLASIAGATPGDYNADGVVNAADYTVWRDHLGDPSGTLPNDPEGGPVGAAQYRIWRENYTGGVPNGLSAFVPEPGSACLAAFAAAWVTGRRGRN